MRTALVVLALLLLPGVAPSEPEPAPDPLETGTPAAGRFLVATERIRGSIFAESVIYLVSYGRGGAVGLIVNRPTHLPLREVLQGADERAGLLHLGGPVDRDLVMMLLRAEDPPEHSSHVADDVFVTVAPDVLAAQTRAPKPGRFRVYAGYAGWGKKQLEGEIARGQWLVVEAPSRSIFEEEPGALWKKLFRAHHRIVADADARGPATRS